MCVVKVGAVRPLEAGKAMGNIHTVGPNEALIVSGRPLYTFQMVAHDVADAPRPKITPHLLCECVWGAIEAFSGAIRVFRSS